MKKIIILGFIVLFVGMGFQPAFANRIPIITKSNNIDDCGCAEKYSKILLIPPKYDPDIKEKFKLLNYEVINNRVNDNFGYCLILYIQTAISVYLAEIFHFISQKYPEDSILYKIFNNLAIYYLNRFYRLFDIGEDIDCWWIPDPPPDP